MFYNLIFTGLIIFCLTDTVLPQVSHPITKCTSEGFTLITMLYNEKNEERANEYIACIEHNLANKYINSIHVIYDVSHDDTTNRILNYLKSKNITLSFIVGRQSYGFCFTLANTLYKNRKIILSNADIFFNDTLAHLINYDLTHKFLTLTRWNVLQDGNIAMFMWQNKECDCSQDTWIFKTPIQKFSRDDFKLGTQHCDGQIAYQAYKAGMQVINPCLTIQCCHLHLSGIRNYDSNVVYPASTSLRVAWSALK